MQNSSGSIIAIFKDIGMAKQFCHQNDFPTNWIIDGEIDLKIGSGR